jgi:hypothetical protein
MATIQCPKCGLAAASVVITKSKAKVIQYAVCCPIHGRLNLNWYTTEAKALAAALITKGKVKWAEPV